MYESLFGLKAKPFDLTPDPRYFYLSETHRKALISMIHGVRDRVGLMALTGPVGVGKTMVLATLLDRVRQSGEAASFSGAISGDRTEFLTDLWARLGFSSEPGSVSGLSQAIRDFALKETEEGRRVVVLVDEVQDLGADALDHFNHLSNLEASDPRLIQIILAGKGNLGDTLEEKGLETLWGRVGIQVTIKPMEPGDAIAYIFHRLRVAGGAPADLFTNDALWRIVNHARGIPLLLNLVCSKAMSVAHSSGSLPVDEESVMEALNEIEGIDSGAEQEVAVARDEIRKLVEGVDGRREDTTATKREKRIPVIRDWTPVITEQGQAVEEGMPDIEIESFRDGQVTLGSRGAELAVLRRRLQTDPLPPFRSRRRTALKTGAGLLLPFVGVLITVGLLKPGSEEVRRSVVVSPQESEARSEGRPPEGAYPIYEAPKSGPEQTGPQKEAQETGSGFPALPAPPPEQAWEGPGGEGMEVDAKKLPERGRITVRQKDFAGIALEHYGRLDLEVLRELRENNPQVGDWNSLDETVQIVLPRLARARNPGVDFYTIQVGAFRSEDGISLTLSKLAERGTQNLFVVRGGDEKIAFVCVGVFESRRQTLSSIQRMQEWGFDGAFPTRIQKQRLAHILQPYPAPGPVGP